MQRRESLVELCPTGEGREQNSGVLVKEELAEELGISSETGGKRGNTSFSETPGDNWFTFMPTF